MANRGFEANYSSREKAKDDWLCSDPECNNLNFAWRTNCNLCGKERSPGSGESGKPTAGGGNSKKLLGHEIGKVAAEKSRGLFSADDWQCNRCGNVNWARRQSCNMCNAPKFGDNEERTGLGGGYNDRETVEYINRSDSDDEYDDFGRKKKKYRGKTSALINSTHESGDDEKPSSSSKNLGDDDDHKVEGGDDDDDEDGDLSKYCLEEDDEEDVHLDKYDLSDLATKWQDKVEQSIEEQVKKQIQIAVAYQAFV
ncbi:zinc finger Ran-binding domain-containing protein 2-like isoform X1 [Dinothrombium tinctorium]|uniref:Zinc finger Ran-binding domain-containing protein 2 n=1 Tax=Dinothrombium tinctorium TaxID=1965070 RepID=A0A3S3PVL4_9ACAR|nr:zinc finger Ran-binding domain-containing protein 2-like isoform X1 [Dinothrombium tinctorium]